MISTRVRVQKGYDHSIRHMMKSTCHRRVRQSRDNATSELFFWIPSVFALVHMVFGILELSSLIFVSAFEALEVLLQYASSAFICQLILQIKLASMRYDLDEEIGSGML